MGALEGRAHHFHVAGAVEGEVGAPFGHAHDVGLNRRAAGGQVERVHKVGRAEGLWEEEEEEESWGG